jgi:hypothetical protein
MKKLHTAILTAALDPRRHCRGRSRRGQVHRPRDPFTDGARAGASASDVYAGARASTSVTFSPTEHVLGRETSSPTALTGSDRLTPMPV